MWLAPLWALVILGLYCLAQLIHGVANFNDCQTASDELRKEIEEARSDLRVKGIHVD